MSASPGATAPPLPVLASRTTADGDTPLQVDVNEVRVRGKVMEVNFTVRNLFPRPAAGRATNRWQVNSFFSDGIYQPLTDGSNELGSVADGIYAIDSANAKRYLVGRAADGSCVCPTNLSGTFISPQQGVVFGVVLGAPPESVTTVDIYIPNAGTFPAVPITR